MTCTQEDLASLHRTFALTRDPALRAELITHYDSLAVRLGRQFSTRRESTEDLIQVARLGLIHAVDRFDPERERPFAAFARSTILGHLKRHIRDKTWEIRPPRRLQEHYLVVVRTRDDLTQTLGRSPTIPEIAQSAGLTDEEVLEAMEVMQSKPLSLDNFYAEDGSPLEVAGDDRGFSRVEEALLAKAVAELVAEADWQILRLRFEEELAQTEIAARLGCSQMYVSRALVRNIERLRVRLAAEWEGVPADLRQPPATAVKSKISSAGGRVRSTGAP
jgi:RNA polymerase sigma-B factor